MEEPRYIWLLERKVLEYFRFEEFRWLEVGLIAIGLTALFLYLVLAFWLDRRVRARERRARERARVERWLGEWRLDDDQLSALYELAGGRSTAALHRLLTSPVRFERRVHEALFTRGGAARFAFTWELRDALRFRTSNASVPVVSTRQLVPGEPFRIAVAEGGATRHFYAWAVTVVPSGVVLELSAEGYDAVQRAEGERELFYLRGHDQEYRFFWRPLTNDPERHRIQIAHTLVRPGHRARGARLLVVRKVHFQALEAPPAGAVAEQATGGPPPPEPATREGVLLDLSEGGFSLVTGQALERGHYVTLVLTRGGRTRLPLTGRVLETRPYAGNQWLVRCELKGLGTAERNTLARILRAELQRRTGRARGRRRR